MTFDQALRLAGMRPRDIVADGKWRRCATDDKPTKRNGAYCLSIEGTRGWWRNWALDSELNTWADDQATTAKPIDQRKLDAQRAAERERRIHAMRGARAYWNRCHPLNRLHPYLEAKGLSAVGTAGLRSIDGLLVIPVCYGDSIISTQSIHPDGTKRFYAGAPVKGGCFVLDRKGAAVTVLVEGLATGLAVFQAMRMARVVVAFDAGNLLPVVDRLRPTGSVVFMADNDHRTMSRRGFNPGIDKAKNAAELVGAGVAWIEGIDGTDAADALKEWGVGAHKRIERIVLAGARYVPSTAREAPA